MYENHVAFSLAAGSAIGFALAALVLMAPNYASAADQPGQHPQPQATEPECSCPSARKKSSRPKFADLKPPSDGGALGPSDELAALTSVQHALSKVGDGSTYVWHRSNGRLSGIVQPTSSFKNADGAICRHLIVMLTTGDKTRKTEGVACRQPNGVWSLEG